MSKQFSHYRFNLFCQVEVVKIDDEGEQDFEGAVNLEEILVMEADSPEELKKWSKCNPDFEAVVESSLNEWVSSHE